MPLPFVAATWNVNSLRMRLERLLLWLAERRPDILCLQELKMEASLFPAEALRQAGYHAAVVGQKGYNGVAVLSRVEHGELADVVPGLQDGVDDPEARLIAATVPALGVRVMSVYVPNGQVVGSDKFAYKLAWLRRLRRYLDHRCDPAAPLLLCGDFNIAPEDRDVHDPELWKDTVICHPEARQGLAEVTAWGLDDALRLVCADGGLYTYWDYRQLAFPRNHGLRIDHVLCSRPLSQRVREVTIDRQARKGKQPSDHAPLLVAFN